MESNTEQDIRARIEDELEKTKQIIVDYKELTKPEGLDSAVGRVSRMDSINNKSVTKAALRQAEEKLKKLNYVHSQIGKPNFGKCVRCGNAIPLGRIILMPQSTHCVNCAR